MSEIDCCIAIALAQAVKKKRKSVKRLWMKEWFKKRGEFTHENLLNEFKLSSPNDFLNFLRMDEEIYEELLTLVAPKIKKQDTQMRDAISPNQRLSITLRYLASGNSFSDLKFTSAISERAIGRIVMETCAEINKALKDYIKIPCTEDGWKKIATDFYRRWNFPNCLGAIDGKHIAIRKPPNSGSFYYNYKKFFRIVLMALVDANYEFVMVDVGTNGRVSDGGVLANTTFGRAFSEGALNLPKPCILPSTDKELPFVFVGDDAFQLTSNLMKPYSQTIVLTCCYLHNFLRRKKATEYISTASVDRENVMDGSVTEGLWREDYTSTPLQGTQCRNSTSTAKLIRDQFCSYFNNEGEVSWQKKFVSPKTNNM